jgi:myo-inositol 2-dehydrogenase/D-chiro-inositol 1-dehydrogenase
MGAHKVALVGAGRMGRVHAANIAACARLDLAGVADHDRASAAALAAEFDTRVAPYEDLLANREVAGVVVASSTSSHLENVIAAVGAGKAVLCEKPMSLDSAALADALPTIEGPGVTPVLVGFNRRFDPHLAALKRRLDDGEAGRIESLHIVNHDPAPPSLDFVPRSGGLFRDFSIHDFDTAAWLLGEPFTEIFAAGECLVDTRIGELGDIDTAKIILRTKSGALCMISNSRRTGYGYDQRVEAFGSKGSLRLDNAQVDKVSLATEEGEQAAPFPYGFADRYAGGYRAELEHFADVLDGKSKPATSPRNALRALALADVAELSRQRGQPVPLPVEEAF